MIRHYWDKWRKLKKTGVHFINAAYLIGFGWSLLHNPFPFSPLLELQKVGISPPLFAYIMITAGIITLIGRDIRLLYFATFAYLPYTIAAWFFLFEHKIGATAMSSTFIQAALISIISLEGILRRGENG